MTENLGSGILSCQELHCDHCKGGWDQYISGVKSLSELHRENAKSLYKAVIHLTSLRNGLGGCSGLRLMGGDTS